MSAITFTGADLSAPILLDGVKLYSDNTPYVKSPEWAEIVEKADTVTIQPTSLTDFVAGISAVHSVQRAYQGFRGRGIRRLVLPYIPGARQDRSNSTGDVTSMLYTVATLINSCNFDEVVVADPHSVRSGFHIHNMVEYPLERIYERLWKGYTGVIVPDKGARHRGLTALIALGTGTNELKELKYGSKVRDVATGRLTGFEVDELTPGAHYIVVDDICDGGGTFVGLGERIAAQGAFADLFVTHGIFTKGTDDLKKYYKSIYTTDTRTVHERNDVMKFSIVEEMRNYNG